MLELNNLTFSYPDKTLALDNISLHIAQGESVGIVGANGAGKSTLVNHLNGWHLPQSGTVTIGGIPVSKKTLDIIRKTVGVIFQNPDDQLFTARVYDDIVFGLLNRGFDTSTIESTVEEIMSVLNISDLQNKPPFNLSQGQKRFVAFAAILVMKPSVLVMDEPTSDLDPRNRRKLIGLIKSLDSTKITVSHDLDFIWETCDRVLILNSGKIVADGASHEILSDRLLLESNGLELPLKLQHY